MSNKVKTMHSSLLIDEGLFSANEVEAAKNTDDGYVGTKDGVMYFRSDVELKMGDFHGSGASAKLPDIQGEGDNRRGGTGTPRE